MTANPQRDLIIAGLMSGTSADGIDVAIAQIGSEASGALRWQLHSHTAHPFAPDVREEILACTRNDSGTVDRICALNVRLGELSAQAVMQAAAQSGLPLDSIDLIGSHGQTVWHIPQTATLQIGSAATIAERTGITVISNFRARDIAAGGHGAPLVAYPDICLLTHPTQIRAAQNIGGIGNVTYLPADQPDAAFAFDTGPGNMLIDDHVRRYTHNQRQFDPDGEMAAEGHVHAGLLAELLAHPFLAQRPPKTTGREMFGAGFATALWERAEALGVPELDRIATVTELTVRSIANAYRNFLPHLPDEVIVSGGGARNATIVRGLELVLGVPVLTSDQIGIPSEAKEALAFAVLAYLSWVGRPSNWPAATGANKRVVLGDFTPGRVWPPIRND